MNHKNQLEYFFLNVIKCTFVEMTLSAAFSVRLHEDTLLSDSPLVYGNVDLNIGGGYDEFTGLFGFIIRSSQDLFGDMYL